MEAPLALLLLLLAALAAVQPGRACNSLIIDGRVPKGTCRGDPDYEGGIVSGSSFSQIFDLAAGLLIGAKGVKLPVLDVTASGTPSLFGPTRKMEVKYSFACLGHDPLIMGPTFGDILTPPWAQQIRNWTVPEGWRICNQGMNAEGLAVSFQANDPEPVPAYDPQSPKKGGAVNFWDLPMALISQYKTVAEIEAAYANYQIVHSPQYRFFPGDPTKSSQWVGVYDRTGAALVIQFRSDGTGVQVLRNGLGVLANEPGFLQDHEAKYLEWVARLKLTVDPKTKLINGPFTTVADPKFGNLRTLGGGFGDKAAFWDLDSVPGGPNGDARFLRMAILKSMAVLKKCWPDPTISPSSPQKRRRGYPELMPSLLAVHHIVQTVALPLGMADFGDGANFGDNPKYNWRQDATFWYTLRDHSNLIFYYRSANNFAYRQISLAEVNWRRIARGGKLLYVRLTGLPDPGIVDVTNDFY